MVRRLRERSRSLPSPLVGQTAVQDLDPELDCWIGNSVGRKAQQTPT